MKKIFLIFALVFFSANSAKATEINDYPTLKIITFDGKNFDLKEKRRKVIIVNFWAKWCGYCRKEMPVLDQLYKKYKASGLEIIGVSVDRKRSYDTAKNFAAQFSYPNSSFYDIKETSFDEPIAIPMSYIIDKEGKIRAVLQGDDEESGAKRFEDLLKPLL